MIITSAVLDDGPAALLLLAMITAQDFPRMEVIFGDNKYHNHKLNDWLTAQRPTWSMEVKQRAPGSVDFTVLPVGFVVPFGHAFAFRLC